MYIVDSRENKSLLRELDLMEVSYRVEEINVYVCKKCKKIYKSIPEKCTKIDDTFPEYLSTCDSEEFIAIKIADITNERRSFFLERKKGKDLSASLDEYHLYDQLERMMTLLTTSSLVFEGDWDELLSDPHNQTRIGQIMSIPATCAQYGVSFIQVKNTKELVKMLKYFDEKSGTEPKLRTQYRPRVRNIPKAMTLYMAVPGISEKLAKNIYEVYPIPVQLAHAIMQGIVKKIQKIGPKKLASLGQHLWGGLYNEETYKKKKKN